MKNWRPLNNIRNAGKLVVTETREEIHIGDRVTDFRGELREITGWDYPHKPSSTGRVYSKGDKHTSSNFPGVFGLEIINDDEQ